MVLPSVIAANEARSNFYQILEEVGKTLRRFVVTHRGKAMAVIMPLSDLESWEETLDILSNKKLVSDLFKSQRDFRKGRFFTLDEVEKEIKKKAS